jgi:hypothetical protein
MERRVDMIIFSLLMGSGIVFYHLLTPPTKKAVIPANVKNKTKRKFRINGVQSNA